MNEREQRLQSILQRGGIATRDVRAYGSQIHFDCAKANAAQARHVMIEAGFKYRGEVGDAWKLDGSRRIGVTLYFTA